jgi:hypothetical protein
MVTLNQFGVNSRTTSHSKDPPDLPFAIANVTLRDGPPRLASAKLQIRNRWSGLSVAPTLAGSSRLAAIAALEAVSNMRRPGLPATTFREADPHTSPVERVRPRDGED